VQPALLPVDSRDLLPAGHLVWDILALTEEFDLSGFEAAYRADGRGRPPFHPRVMLALVLYCRAKRLVSSREIAAACYDDLGARVITGGRYPDRSTVDRFLNTHTAALRGLLPQTLRLGHAEGLVDVSVVAGDGTKVLANAAMGATVDEADLRAQIDVLRQQVDAAQTAWADRAGHTGGAQPALFDDGPGAGAAGPAGTGSHTTAWRRLLTMTRTLHERQAALAWLHTHPTTTTTEWSQRLQHDRDRVTRCTQRLDTARGKAQTTQLKRDQAAARGRKLPGSIPASIDEHAHVRQALKAVATATARAEATAANPPAAGRVNTTDPTSRIMPGKHDGFGQRHNIQALAVRNQFIIAIGTHDSPNDKQALTTLLHQARTNLDTAGITTPIGTALFDNGYASDTNFTTDHPVDLLLVATGKEAHQTGRQPGPTTTPTAWQTMADRLAEPDNHTLYKQRAAIIEPLFAQLFARFGRTLHRRGDAAITELHLWAITHNLLKIIRHRQRPD